MNKPARKKLIEVALPLEAINEASVREGYIYRGNPSAIHKWWAQRPLAAARAVIFAQMVDDPSSWPDLFTTVKAQEKERQRLFSIIERLVTWENIMNDDVIQEARDEIWRSWRRACAENVDHPHAKTLFARDSLPPFFDPFAGGGTLPIEAQRLGLKPFSSDLNPVAVLINRGLIEIPPRLGGKPPVNPVAQSTDSLFESNWTGTQGIADDVRFYGRWVCEEARKRLASLYPQVTIGRELVSKRPDLAPYLNQSVTVIAWLWVRTVKSPNPAFREVEVPLASTFMLSTKTNSEVYVEPVIQGKSYSFEVRVGRPTNPDQVKNGTKLGGSGTSFGCLMSGAPMPFDYIRNVAKDAGLGTRLMALVAEGGRGRVYLSASEVDEAIAFSALPNDPPEADLPSRALGFRVQEYGMTKWRDLFTSRQLVALETFSQLIEEVQHKVKSDAIGASFPIDEAEEYAKAIGLYLNFCRDKVSEYGCSIVPWNSKENRPKSIFVRHAIPMLWDYAEVNPLSSIGGSFEASVGIVAGALLGCPNRAEAGSATHADAVRSEHNLPSVISTDPPYYDNIGYADLSDFFYVWLRRSLRAQYPQLFGTLLVPKSEELIATPYRHSSKDAAESFFLEGMTAAMKRLAEVAHPAFPVTIYYAFKQSESKANGGEASTGWETFLSAVIRAGFTLTGTWPIRTERGVRSIGIGTNALASSVVLVCRRRENDTGTATKREFLTALARELPAAIADLQRGNVAPVDLQQAAIGPGMAIFTRYSSVLDAEGNPLTVREALTLINQSLDEVLAHQEGDFDSDTRWALAWFEQFGFSEGDYGIAEMLSKAKNTSVDGIRQAGIGTHGKGKVRLYRPEELPSDWSPESDNRLTVWDMVHHLIRSLDLGEEVAGRLLAKLGTQADVARELAYRLYSICERKKRSADGQRYNALVSSWPELVRLAQQTPRLEQGPQQSFEGMN
ncbi:MAG TPA: DUF1156 domain-containing protein [Fimbriimonadaceae bacterium]|jgi:putative DNA methylase|nr:DUF1156 domain-containing protein [Fimbriimonadaceae bacterium]